MRPKLVKRFCALRGSCTWSRALQCEGLTVTGKQNTQLSAAPSVWVTPRRCHGSELRRLGKSGRLPPSRRLPSAPRPAGLTSHANGPAIRGCVEPSWAARITLRRVFRSTRLGETSSLTAALGLATAGRVLAEPAASARGARTQHPCSQDAPRSPAPTPRVSAAPPNPERRLYSASSPRPLVTGAHSEPPTVQAAPSPASAAWDSRCPTRLYIPPRPGPGPSPPASRLARSVPVTRLTDPGPSTCPDNSAGVQPSCPVPPGPCGRCYCDRCHLRCRKTWPQELQR